MSGLLLQKLCQKSRSSNSSKLGMSGPLFAYGGFYGAGFTVGFKGSTLERAIGYLLFLGLS